MDGLNQFSQWADIQRVAHKIEGKTLRQLIPDEASLTSLRGKGAVGQLIESELFGVESNSRPEADFVTAQIELKVVPLERKMGKGLSVKERTKICSINYEELVNETWETSHAWGKLKRILMVFYDYDAADIGACKIVKCYLYEPDMSDQDIFQADWKRVVNYVKAGEAHRLSESISKALAASRTGQGGVNADGIAKDLVRQPIVTYSATAMRRAFSLKTGFTNQLFAEIKNKKAFISLRDLTNASSLEDLLQRTVDGINQYSGWTLERFATHHDVPIPEGKNASASIIRNALGIRKKDARFREFERYGITVKVPPLNSDLSKSWEDVSFPHQPLSEIMDEGNFFDSMIAEWTQTILFVPILRDAREDKKAHQKRIGRAFVWTPTDEEHLTMAYEYDAYLRVLSDGLVVVSKYNNKGDRYRENNLPKKSKTRIIHMRTHGADSDDVDTSYPGVAITKQSFWLNGSYVAELARRTH